MFKQWKTVAAGGAMLWVGTTALPGRAQVIAADGYKTVTTSPNRAGEHEFGSDSGRQRQDLLPCRTR